MTKAETVYNQLVEGSEGLTVFVKDNPITKIDNDRYAVNHFVKLENVYNEPNCGYPMGLEASFVIESKSQLLEYLEIVYSYVE